MKKGENKKTFAYYEEIPHLKVDEFASPVFLYKRQDQQLNKEIEHRTFYVSIPVPKCGNGKRLSLRTTSRERALQLAHEKVIEVRTQLAQGLKIKFTTTEKFAIEFLKYKKSLVRDDWEGKEDAGLKSITKQRFKLIEGKIRNYFLPFVGASSNAKNLSYKKFDQEWQLWRKDNPSGIGKKRKKPKQSTIKDEMGMIREIWSWGQMNGYIQPSERKPFDYENLIPDDVIKRETFELSEWQDFKEDLALKWFPRQIANNQENDSNALNAKHDALIVMNLIMILAETGIRVGEAFKLRWKDIKFFTNKENHGSVMHTTGVLIQIHKSSKTGAREVNSDAGHGFEIIKNYLIKNVKPVKENDFIFTHLNGEKMSVRWFSDQFAKIRDELELKEKTGKHIVPYSLRHYYCTSRIYAGVSYEVIADNMGIDSKMLKKSYKHSILRMQHKELFKPIYVDDRNLQTRSFDKENPTTEIIKQSHKKRTPKLIKQIEKNLDIQVTVIDDKDGLA